MLSLKEGVKIRGLRPEALFLLIVAHESYSSRGENCIVTSGVEGEHSRGSEHYAGSALDFRINHLPAGMAEDIREDIARRVGPDYDIILERTHIHGEYDPKGQI